jgi:hypothetical protein
MRFGPALSPVFLRTAFKCVMATAALLGVTASACTGVPSASVALNDAGDGAATCNQLMQLGAFIEIKTVSERGPLLAEAPTSMDSVPKGVFVLSKIDYYAGSGVTAAPTGVVLRQTLAFEGSILSIVQSDSAGETRSQGAVTVMGGVLVRIDSCVSGGEGTVPAPQARILKSTESELVLAAGVSDAGSALVVSTYVASVEVPDAASATLDARADASLTR